MSLPICHFCLVVTKVAVTKLLVTKLSLLFSYQIVDTKLSVTKLSVIKLALPKIRPSIQGINFIQKWEVAQQIRSFFYVRMTSIRDSDNSRSRSGSVALIRINDTPAPYSLCLPLCIYWFHAVLISSRLLTVYSFLQDNILFFSTVYFICATFMGKEEKMSTHAYSINFRPIAGIRITCI